MACNCSEGNLPHLSEEDRVGLPDMVEHLQDGGGDVPPADLLVEDVVRHEGKAANSSLRLCTSFPSTGGGSGRKWLYLEGMYNLIHVKKQTQPTMLGARGDFGSSLSAPLSYKGAEIYLFNPTK